MSAVSDILRNFQLFVDGRGFAGNCPEVQLPKLTIKTEDFQAGGLDIPIGIDMGQEKMELGLTLDKFDRDVLGLWGVYDTNPPPVILRGALVDQAGNVKAAVITARGPMREVDFGSWAAGSKAQTAFKVECHAFRLEIAGRIVIDIDALNMVRRINGVDQLAAIRNAIGA